MIRSVRRNEVESDEYYFSVAEHGFGVLGCEQVVGPEGIYMDFQGDRPDVNNGSLPTCLSKSTTISRSGASWADSDMTPTTS